MPNIDFLFLEFQITHFETDGVIFERLRIINFNKREEANGFSIKYHENLVTFRNKFNW